MLFSPRLNDYDAANNHHHSPLILPSENMNHYLEQKLTDIANNPFHQFIGIHNLHSAKGEGGLQITVHKNISNPNCKLHDGIIYALGDVCGYIALASLLPENKEAVTHDIRVSVLRAANEGDTLLFRANVSKLGRNLNTQVFKGDTLMAEARVTKSLIDLRPV